MTGTDCVDFGVKALQKVQRVNHLRGQFIDGYQGRLPFSIKDKDHVIKNATNYSLVQPDSCMIYNTDYDLELLMRPVSTESRY